MAQVTEEQVLGRLREICLALPGTEEVISHGHPAFKASGRIYVVLEEYEHELSLCVKVGRDVQDIFLKDERFYRTPYIGQHGWVSLRVHAAPLHWTELKDLIIGSYQLVNQKQKPRPAKKTD